jgi:hypothetical protein
MVSERRMQEIDALLEQHQLDTLRAVLEKKSGDFNLILGVLLRSYAETGEVSFFSHFYSLTAPIIVSDVKRFLDEEEMSADPEEFITEIYETVLRSEDTGSFRKDDSILYHCSAVAAQIVHLRKVKSADAGRCEQLPELPSVAGSPVAGQSVPLEEKRRAGLLVARIREVVLGGCLGLNAREEIILGHFYRDGLTCSEVAVVMETNLQEISETLYQVRKRVQQMVVHSNDGANPGELS